jgi:hypothetical protein
MNKTLWMTMTALAFVGLVGAAVPTASACASADYFLDTACDPGDKLDDSPEEVAREARNEVRQLTDLR